MTTTGSTNENASLRIIATAGRPSATLLRACARFGLAARRSTGEAHRGERARRGAAALHALAVAGALTLLLGPSGSGKTTALRALAALARRRRASIIAPSDPRRAQRARALIDQLPGPLDRRLDTLASAGLGEAALLARRPGELSEGERARARLALAMARAARRASGTGPCTLLIDEFTSGLDRATAVSLGASLSRWCARHPAVRVIAATSREDLAGAIRGASVVHVRDLHAIGPR